MSGTIYYADAAPTPGIQREIDRAQAILDAHASDLNGMCLSCRVTSPCARREPAVAVFYRYYRLCLPKRERRPATQPPGLSRVDWFAARAERITGRAGLEAGPT